MLYCDIIKMVVQYTIVSTNSPKANLDYFQMSDYEQQNFAS